MQQGAGALSFDDFTIQSYVGSLRLLVFCSRVLATLYASVIILQFYVLAEICDLNPW